MRTKLYAALTVAIVSLGLWIGKPQAANASMIEYQATNVSGNTWQYDYYVSGFDFLANYTFGVSFDYQTYQNLQNPAVSPAPALWDVLSIEPDTILLLQGQFYGSALVDHPSTTLPFMITFDWLGVGDPGSQPFDIFDDMFTVVSSGVTTLRQIVQPPSPPPPPPVAIPSPITPYLILIGFMALMFARKRNALIE